MVDARAPRMDRLGSVPLDEERKLWCAAGIVDAGVLDRDGRDVIDTIV